ncbi:endonuclease/exonuclease/phosphatase family protein [Actinomycetospora sp. TBRC 11914]|uniref:endonuclease/exonuclease/phosphatase family protein n=1 Tax=Actinomycetospora sp. TBRC 11914 TaxID=2729387 RepID=UPI001B7D51EC|nr:endonuclease/exonuclease/phosphatase family protein [Actinomycetospora sp. TBRC 11914]
MTWNVLHGCSPDDGRVDPGRFAAAVRALDADVLALQEVDRGQERSGGADLAGIAAEAMGADDHRFAAALVGPPGAWSAAPDEDRAGGPGDAAADATAALPATAPERIEALVDPSPREPAYGVALISRLPVLSWRAVRVPPLPRPMPLLVGRPLHPAVVHDEPRVAVAARVATDDGEVTVATTHLSFIPGWNLVQLRRLVRALDREVGPGPLVLTGDLNTGPRRAAWVSGLTGLAAGPTFPAAQPRAQLDHVLGRQVRASDGEVRHLPVSDHRALGVTLRRA